MPDIEQKCRTRKNAYERGRAIESKNSSDGKNIKVLDTYYIGHGKLIFNEYFSDGGVTVRLTGEISGQR